MEKSRLEELSLALPEKERKELLERISKRLEKEQVEEAIPIELEEAEREKIISYEMKKAQWWVRFMVWLRTFFSGRSKLDVFLEIRLRMLKARIRSVNPGLTGFDTRDLNPKLARRVYDLYTKLVPLMALYQALTTDRGIRAQAYAYLMETRFDKAKRTLEDFVSTKEMEDLFSRTGDAEEIRRKLSQRMNDYIRATPESLFSVLEDQTRLHLAVGKLCAFSFAGLFRYFNYMLIDQPPGTQPVFEHAPVMLTLDLLEKLHAAVTIVMRAAPPAEYCEEPLAYYLLSCSGLRPDQPFDSAKLQAELARVRAEITAACKEAEDFEAEVPLMDIIRFFRKDPYYNLMINPPRLHLKSLYFTTLKAKVSAEMEERLLTIKEQVITKKIQDILKSQKLVELGHYKESQGLDFKKLGLPTFAYVRSLNLLLNYITTQYKGFIQEAVQIVANTALANNRITQNRLMQNVSGLEDLEAKIVLFDRSLSLDEEDGKQLARFRFNVATDLILQKSYKAFVVQKDREARDLVEKGKDSLGGVKKIFDEIRMSSYENTRSLLKTLHMYKGKNQTLAMILNSRSEAIGVFLSLMDQLLELEKGS